MTPVKFSLEKNSKYYQVDLARDILQFFRANNWHGSMPSMVRAAAHAPP